MYVTTQLLRVDAFERGQMPATVCVRTALRLWLRILGCTRRFWCDASHESSTWKICNCAVNWRLDDPNSIFNSPT